MTSDQSSMRTRLDCPRQKKLFRTVTVQRDTSHHILFIPLSRFSYVFLAVQREQFLQEVPDVLLKARGVNRVNFSL